MSMVVATAAFSVMMVLMAVFFPVVMLTTACFVMVVSMGAFLSMMVLMTAFPVMVMLTAARFPVMIFTAAHFSMMMLMAALVSMVMLTAACFIMVLMAVFLSMMMLTATFPVMVVFMVVVPAAYGAYLLLQQLFFQRTVIFHSIQNLRTGKLFYGGCDNCCGFIQAAVFTFW